MPVGRVVRGQPGAVDQLTGGLAAEQPVVQEQPGGAAGGVRGGGVAGGLPVLVQPPGRGQRLVEGGAPAGGGRVAVPPAVGPLPGDQGCGQGAYPRVGGQAEPGSRRPGRFPRWRRGCGPARRCAGRAGPGWPARPGRDRQSQPRAAPARGRPARPAKPAASARRSTCGTGAPRTRRPAAGRTAARSPWPRPAPGRHPHLPVHRGGRGGSSAGWPARRCSAARLWRRASADPCPCRLRPRSPA